MPRSIFVNLTAALDPQAIAASLLATCAAPLNLSATCRCTRFVPTFFRATACLDFFNAYF